MAVFQKLNEYLQGVYSLWMKQSQNALSYGLWEKKKKNSSKIPRWQMSES